MILHAALLAALALAPTQEIPGSIRGTVRGAIQGATHLLPQAMVEVTFGPRRRLVGTDAQGRYSIGELPPGPVTVRVVHIGYEPLDLEARIPAGGTLRLDVQLDGRPIRLDPVRVVVEPVPEPAVDVPDARPDLVEADLRALEGGTGLAEAGIGEAVRGAPGNPPSDPSDVLVMRGSTTDLKLVLLDGAPVYAPFHMGGLIRAFDPTSLGSAELYVGGAPARYDGGLSYILDMRTRSTVPERLGVVAAVDMMSGRGTVTGPLGRSAGFAVSGRSLHGLANAVLADGRRPYGYGDLLARVGLEIAPGHRVRATGFWNREAVFLDLSGPSSPAALSWTPDDATWGNQALSVGYEARGDRIEVDVTGALTHYEARLPLGGEEAHFAEGVSRRGRLVADFRAPTRTGSIYFGGSYDRLDVEYGVRRLPSSASTRSEGVGSTIGAYAEGRWPLGPAVRLRAGLRGDRYSTENGLRVAPRAALTWALSDVAVLTLAGGRYHQYVRASDERVQVAMEGPLGVPVVETLLPVASSTHLMVSLDQQVTRELRMSLDGFTKSFEGIGGEAGNQLSSSGVDLRVARVGSSATGWLGYSLSWFWSGGGFGTASDFAGRHLLSAGIESRLGDRGGIKLRVGFGDGLPYTTVPLGDDDFSTGVPGFNEAADAPTEGGDAGPGRSTASSAVFESFLRVDAEIYGSIRTGFGGRDGGLRPYLRLLNALDRRDALFYYFEPWRGDDPRPLAELPFLPVVGLEWRF